MGTTCCSSRQRLEPQSSRDKDVERRKLNIIYEFDLNKDFIDKVTFEESIMKELTNDIGVQITPQVTNMIISEFKKFMFLNLMNIKELSKKPKPPFDNYLSQDDSARAYISLAAPPLIDTVWKCFIRRETTYKAF